MRLTDADWVAERLKEWRYWIAETYGENDDYVLCLDTVLMKLDDAPTADVEPVKHGHWRYDEALELEWCSECGFGKRKGDKRWYSYCPNCGAYMGVKDVRESD